MRNLHDLGKYTPVLMQVYIGNLTDLGKREGVDAIVNPANRALCLGWGYKRPIELVGFSVGGVAKAIGEMAGGKVSEECRSWARQHGWLAPGQAMCTSGGELPVDYIIHVVSTRFLGSNERLIRDSVKNSVDLAYKEGMHCVAYPLLGTGAGMVGLEKSAEWMLDEMHDNVKEGFLERVIFSVLAVRDYDSIKKVFGELDKRFHSNTADFSPLY